MSDRMVSTKPRPRPMALQRNPSSAVLSQFIHGEDIDERLSRALESPDAQPGRASEPPAAERKAEVLPIREPAPSTFEARMPSEAPKPPVRPEPPLARQPAPPAEPIADQASISVPEREKSAPSRRHRRYGNRDADKQAVDMTMSMDPVQAERLTELAAYEMLRIKSRVSVSEVVRHLIDFALAHIEDNKVIPTPDGAGLHIQSNGG